jgi:regulatory LuxR family protein
MITPRTAWRAVLQAPLIAALAAGGVSNLGIAQELQLSVRTVEAHLARAYTNLGIRTRVAPVVALGDGYTRVSRAAGSGSRSGR